MNAFLRRPLGGERAGYKYVALGETGESRSGNIWTKKRFGLIVMIGTFAAVVGVVGVVG